MDDENENYLIGKKYEIGYISESNQYVIIDITTALAIAYFSGKDQDAARNNLLQALKLVDHIDGSRLKTELEEIIEYEQSNA